MESDQHQFDTDDIWTFYFHDPYNVDWTFESYIRVCDVASLDVNTALLSYCGEKITQGMFFLFRESVFPCWDDPSNINGGSLSFKVAKDESARFWADLTSRMLREDLVIDGHKDSFDFDTITGMSISPKKGFCIVKIWVKDVKLCERKFLNLDPNYDSEILFKPHRENIQNNHCVAAKRKE